MNTYPSLRVIREPQNPREEEICRLIVDLREHMQPSLETELMAPIIRKGPASPFDHMSINWRNELLWLLTHLPVGYISIYRLQALVGVADTTVFLTRQKDRELANVIRAWQGAWFELAAQGETAVEVAPSLTVFGLKARSGWRDQQADSLSPDRLTALIEGMIQDITAEIPDEALRARLGQKLLKRLEDAKAPKELAVAG